MLIRHRFAADAILAAVCTAVTAAEVFLFNPLQVAAGTGPPTWVLLVAAFGLTVPLVWRRLLPLWSAFLVFVAAAVATPQQTGIWIMGLALYSATVHARGRARFPVVVVCVLATAGPGVVGLFLSGRPAEELAQQIALLAFTLVLLALPVALGVAVRALRERQRELVLRAVQLQEQRAENARRAVFEERVRIARELHDVVTDHVGEIGVQAGAARLLLETRPADAAEAMGAIEASSRDAVTKMHELLGFLRREDQSDELAPQPGLDQLPALVRQVGRSSLDVRGDPRPIPPTIDVSAYRVVQEALIDTVKRSSRGSARVLVRYLPAAIEVEVIDNGPQPRSQDDTWENGFVGLRERVALHGGRLRIGPRPTGGFGVDAIFPLDEREDAP